SRSRTVTATAHQRSFLLALLVRTPDNHPHDKPQLLHSIPAQSKGASPVAKTISPDEAVHAGLQKAVEALPATLSLSGPGGVFPGGAKGKQLADLAIAQGFLT